MIINDTTFLLYAAKNYENICLDDTEFLEDLQRFKYLKKIFFRYRKYGEINERLTLNHLVVLYNVFETQACTKLLSFKLHNYLEELFTFLEFLGYLPDVIDGIAEEGYQINTKDISKDENLRKKLDELLKARSA